MQALAFAAREKGIKAHIVIPLGAPSVKVNAVKGYGAEVSLYLQKGGMGAQLLLCKAQGHPMRWLIMFAPTSQVYMCEPTQKSREETAAQVVERTGGAFVHPSNDPLVISGQVSILEPKDEQRVNQGGGYSTFIYIYSDTRMSMIVATKPTKNRWHPMI